MSAGRAVSEHHGGGRNFTSDAAQFMSDEALVAGAKMGHGSFFDELHERHRERMFRLARRRITRHHEDAQDAVQESFLSAYVHLKKFDERTRFSTWLTRIAINAALMKIRKNRVSREVGRCRRRGRTERLCAKSRGDLRKNRAENGLERRNRKAATNTSECCRTS
jgi:RNA polymerase sigma factor (sigma-70 family)